MGTNAKERSGNGSFSAEQLHTLEAMLDTFLPSLELPPPPPSAAADKLSVNEEDIRIFYKLSVASQLGLTAYAAHLMSTRLHPEDVSSIKLLLHLLSSRLGTFILLGPRSLQLLRLPPPCSVLFIPSLRRLSDIPPPNRARLLLSYWSLGSFHLLRKAFNAFKIFASYTTFTKIGKDGRNPTWNAIGYCGPDPAAYAHRLLCSSPAPKQKKPLDGGVLDVGAMSPDSIRAELQSAGFEIIEDVSELQELWRRQVTEETAADMEEEVKLGVGCDAVVVGSGCGGGVVAAQLAEAGYKVLVVEKGRYYAREDLSLLESEAMENLYESGGILSTVSGDVLMLAGSTVGGGTTVNWGASIPTPANVVREWAEDLGLPLFAAGGSFQAATEAVLRRLSVNPSNALPPPPVENLQNKALRLGCHRLSLRVKNVATNSASSPHNCGWCCFGCWSGAKQATSETWLADAVATGHAKILADVSATYVLHRSAEEVAAPAPHSEHRRHRRAVGLVAWNASHRLRFFISSRITVVSGGALNTPVLLRRSGLRNPNIGKHLHLHPVQMVWGYFPRGDVKEEAEGGGSLAALRPYEGAIISAMCDELREERGIILQCPSLHPGVFSVVTPWTCAEDFRERMQRYAKTAFVFALVRDRGGNGEVLRDGRVKYKLGKEDEAALMEGAAMAARVLAAAGAKEVGTNHRTGLRAGAEEVERLVREVRRRGVGAPLSSAHQMGTCRMGRREEMSGVDWEGQTWEVGGLYVADGSVLPTAVGVNPMITIQSVALCIGERALHFLQRQQQSSPSSSSCTS